MKAYERRDILRLFGVSGVTFASGLWGCAAPGVVAPAAPGSSASSAMPLAGAGNAPPPPHEEFFFLQISDTHWGFSGPPNPEAASTLRSAVATINAVPARPDFLIFTGDLTHT